MTYSDDFIRSVLTKAQVIAVVGFSANPARPSHYVTAFLQTQGYRVIPVYPGLAGQTHLGETVFADLASVPMDVDMIDVFRRSDAVPEVVDAALARWPHLPSIWMQLGVVHEAAATKAKERGVDVIMDRCPKIEIPRLGLLKTA